MRFILSSLSRDENMNSRRLHPLRTPEERVRPVATATEMFCTAENGSVPGENRGMEIIAASKKQLFKNKRNKLFTYEP